MDGSKPYKPVTMHCVGVMWPMPMQWVSYPDLSFIVYFCLKYLQVLAYK